LNTSIFGRLGPSFDVEPDVLGDGDATEASSTIVGLRWQSENTVSFFGGGDRGTGYLDTLTCKFFLSLLGFLMLLWTSFDLVLRLGVLRWLILVLDLSAIGFRALEPVIVGK